MRYDVSNSKSNCIRPNSLLRADGCLLPVLRPVHGFDSFFFITLKALTIVMSDYRPKYRPTTLETNLVRAIWNLDKNEIVKILQLDTIDSLKTYTDDNGDTLLHWAMKRATGIYNDISMLEVLLILGVDINAKNRSGQTIFHLACERRQKPMIDFCMRRNADLNMGDNHGDTAAHLAIENERQRMSERIEKYNDYSYPIMEESESFFDWMVSRGVDFFHARNQKGLSALYLANELGVYHILVTLLKRVTDLVSVEKGLTPLLSSFLTNYRARALVECEVHYYRFSYVPTIVQIILEKSEFISDTTLLSSLRAAITGRHTKYTIVTLLKRATTNVDPDKAVHGSKSLLEALFNERPENHEGRTMAQILFLDNPKIEILQLLRDFKADFSAIDDLGQSFLHFACEYGKKAEMIDFLMMNETCNVNATDSNGETPLHLAAISFNEDLVKALIQHGAKVNVKDVDGKTPLHVTSSLAIDADTAQIILEAGAEVNAKDKMGKTPLHYVLKPEVAEVLRSFGAHVDILDVNGCSPLYDLLSNELMVARMLLDMLKYGADVQDPKIFELLQASPMRCRVKSEELCLKQHFVKLIAIDEHCKLPFATVEIMDANNREFLKECQKEVKSLKNYSINDRTSLYCFLRKNRNQRCSYLDNEKLKNLVGDAAIERKFPNYSVLILGCYNEATRRKPLLESATNQLNEVIETLLPDLCIDKILKFLSNGDLLRFIETFENVNLNGLSESFGKIRV